MLIIIKNAGPTIKVAVNITRWAYKKISEIASYLYKQENPFNSGLSGILLLL